MHSEGYSTWFVCVCVCLSVYLNSWPTGYEPAYERYQRLKRTNGLKNNVADFAETSVFKLEQENWDGRERHGVAQPIN